MQSNARKNGLNTVLLTFTLHSYFLCIGNWCVYSTMKYHILLGDMFYRFGLIDVPDEVKEKMGHPQNRKICCYVQKSTVICAVTEDVNLSWEGW